MFPLPKPSPFHYPPSFIYLLFLSQKQKQNKNNPPESKNHKQKKSFKTNQEWAEKPGKQRRNIESVMCWPTSPGHGVCPGCGWYTQWHSIGKNQFSLSWQVAIASWLGGRTFHPLSLVSAGILSTLPLHRSCGCCHSLWAHMCMCPAVSGTHCFPGAVHHLWLLKCSCLFFHIDQSLAMKDLRKTSHVGLRLQSLSLSAYCLAVSESLLLAIYPKKNLL